ncbi:tripartite tricarboxylate transporter substrate binding protein [Achromobacter sp. F4_2707]|uniref:Bug family tripartite tricarboxylate transporter substrate binding protein n=1 Tax=Achromobacter sp. F4_2707 TaxID=3114286 RepID=UPI0039C734F5
MLKTQLHSVTRKVFAAAAISLFGMMSAPAMGNTYPQKPITIVAPFPPGGAVDLLARVVGEHLSAELGQTVAVENKAGAGTVIGATYVARSRPDGYTLLLATNTTMVTNRFLFKELSYEPDAFEPVGMLGQVPMVLITSKKSEFDSFEAMIDLAKKRPGDLTMASVGMGTTSHLALENLKQMGNVDVTHVPFNGIAQVLPALVNGDVDGFFDTVSTGMKHVQSGHVNAVALTSADRVKAYPELKTIAEMGYPNFDMSIWFSLVAPAGTPDDVLKTLRDALRVVSTKESYLEKLSFSNIEPTDTDPQFLKDQIAKEAQVIKVLVENSEIEQR